MTREDLVNWSMRRHRPLSYQIHQESDVASRGRAYNDAYAHFPASQLTVVTEQGHDVLYGIWLFGNDYRNRSRLYGAYPPGYLTRVWALFSDITPSRRTVLHVFSGSLRRSSKYLRLDSQPRRRADIVGSVYDVGRRLRGRRFKLVFADPPYSKADAEKYGTAMVDRGRALRALARVTARGGFVVWLDTTWPMHRKTQWRTVARIAVVRSTNHRTRMVTIFQRVGR